MEGTQYSAFTYSNMHLHTLTEFIVSLLFTPVHGSFSSVHKSADKDYCHQKPFCGVVYIVLSKKSLI